MTSPRWGWSVRGLWCRLRSAAPLFTAAPTGPRQSRIIGIPIVRRLGDRREIDYPGCSGGGGKMGFVGAGGAGRSGGLGLGLALALLAMRARIRSYSSLLSSPASYMARKLVS